MEELAGQSQELGYELLPGGIERADVRTYVSLGACHGLGLRRLPATVDLDCVHARRLPG